MPNRFVSIIVKHPVHILQKPNYGDYGDLIWTPNILDLYIQHIRGVFEKYRDCMLCTNNTCNSDKSFVF